MNAITITPEQFIFAHDNELRTTSIKVAEAFGKLHKDVIRKIESLECSKDFHERNFAPMQIDVEIGNGAVRKSPAYEMTKDGFMFLVMGFTGKAAASIKEAYINAFNLMSSRLFGSQPTPTEPPRLTHATKQQREPLVNAVRRLVKVAQSKGHPITYDQAHSIINLKMGVSGIEDMTPEQIPQAMTLVGDLLEKIVLEGEYLAKPDAPEQTPAPSHTFQHVPLDQITSRFDVFFRNDPYWSKLSKMSMIVITSVAWNTLRGTLNDDDLCFLNSAMSHLTIPRAHPLDGLVGRVVDALEKQALR